MSLLLTPEQISQIEREGAAAYPNECCGAMLGKMRATARPFAGSSIAWNRCTIPSRPMKNIIASPSIRAS